MEEKQSEIRHTIEKIKEIKITEKNIFLGVLDLDVIRKQHVVREQTSTSGILQSIVYCLKKLERDMQPDILPQDYEGCSNSSGIHKAPETGLCSGQANL